VVTPEAKRAVVGFWRDANGLSERRACGLIELNCSSLRYERRADRNVVLRQRLRELAEQRRRFGHRRLHVLLCREGPTVNKKRIQRLCRQEGLSPRGRRRKKRRAGLRVVLPQRLIALASSSAARPSPRLRRAAPAERCAYPAIAVATVIQLEDVGNRLPYSDVLVRNLLFCSCEYIGLERT
jgi:hypothetical protein